MHELRKQEHKFLFFFFYFLSSAGQLLEDFQSSDVEVQEKAVAKADCYITALDKPCMTKVNKTTINTNPPVHPSMVKHAQKVTSILLYSCFLSVSVFVTVCLFASFFVSPLYLKRVNATNNVLLC